MLWYLSETMSIHSLLVAHMQPVRGTLRAERRVADRVDAAVHVPAGRVARALEKVDLSDHASNDEMSLDVARKSDLQFVFA
jgi:hypothetical protein